MSEIYGVGGANNGSPVYGMGALKNGSPIYGDGGQDSGSIIYGGFGDKHATRLIPTLAGSQYGTLDTPYTFSGAGEIDVIYATTLTGVEYDLINGYTVTAGNVFSTLAEVTDILVDGVSVGLGGAAPSDGKIHIVTFVVNAGVAKTHFWQDGAGGAFFIGQTLAIKFIDQSGSPDVITNYVFDSGSDLYQLPRGEGLGENKVTGDNSTFDTSLGDWTAEADITAARDTVIFTSGGIKILTNGGVLRDTTLTLTGLSVGTLYKVSCQAYAPSSNIIANGAVISMEVDPADLDLAAQVSSEDTIEDLSFSFKATATSMDIWLYCLNIGTAWGSANDVAYFDNISIQEMPDLTCLLTNFATTDWNRYTQQRNITHDAGVIGEAWVGDNIVINERFDTDTVWVKGIGWTIGSGVGSGAAGTASGVLQNAGTLSGGIYLAKIEVSNYSAGNVHSYVGSQLGAALLANGQYAEITTDGGIITETGAWKDAAFAGDIDNIAVQHLLEIA